MPIASTAWLQDRQGREPLSPHFEIQRARGTKGPLRVPIAVIQVSVVSRSRNQQKAPAW